MSDELTLDVGQANEIKLAARKAGATNADLKRLCEANNFATILPVLRGQAEVKLINFFRQTGELDIQIPVLPRPTLEGLRKEWDWIRKIEFDRSPEGEVTLELGTLLLPKEDGINGADYERRREQVTGLLGLQHAHWLVDHQDEFPAFKALLGKVYIDFPGIVVVRADGYRRFPCLSRLGERWSLDWDWTVDRLGSRGRVARSRPAKAA